MTAKLSESYYTRIVALARQGLSTRAIACQLAISKSCVGTVVLQTIGRKRRSPLRLLDKLGLSDNDVAVLYENLGGLSQVAKHLNISREPVRQALHRLGCLPTRDGRVLSNDYVFMLQPSHPRASKWGYVREHILVWEHIHQRLLPQGWAVHHLNGIKTDNRPENLIAMPSKRHSVYIPALKKRIRELEAKNKMLEQALERGQMMFTIGEN